MADIEDPSVNENGEPLEAGPESPTPIEPASELDSPPAERSAAPAEPPFFEWPAPVVHEPPVEPGMPAETPLPVDAPVGGFAPEPQVEPAPGVPTAEPSEPAPVIPPVVPVVPEPMPEIWAAPSPEVPLPPEFGPSPAPAVPAEPVAVAAAAGETDAAGFSDGLTGELRALTDSLEQPGGDVTPVADEPAPAQDVATGPAEETAAEPVAAHVAAAPSEEAAAAGAAESLDDIAPGTVATETEVAAGAEAVPEGAVAPTAVEGEATTTAAAAEGEEAAEGAEPVVTAEGAEPAEAAEGEAAAEGAEPAAATDAEAAAAAEGVDEGELAEVQGPRSTVSWWPFIAYIVVWLGAAGYAVWQLQQLPVGQAAYETNLYTMSMLGGLVLLAVGPVLLLIVWLASWIGRANRRIGLMFISALLKGALSTLIGAIIWIGALLLVDYLRLGRPF